MKLYIKIYKDNNFGNYRSDLLIIPNNKIKVSTFKQIVQEKYGVNHSNQRLTIKMSNSQFVTLTDDFPLNFYFIKQNSIIYLEFMGKVTKMDEITKKMHQRAIKTKYLKTLGIFGNSPLETIKESTFEKCSSLNSVNLPDDLKIIEWKAFKNCKSLREIIIPSHIDDIADDAFEGCKIKKLKKLKLFGSTYILRSGLVRLLKILLWCIVIYVLYSIFLKSWLIEHW
jgi:hypothetical protein